MKYLLLLLPCLAALFLIPNYASALPQHWAFVSHNDWYNILQYDEHGGFIRVFGGWTSAQNPAQEGETGDPYFLATDSHNRLYVTERNAFNYIDKFTSSGDFMFRFGDGTYDGSPITNISGIAVDSHDDIFVVDSDNCRVLKFEQDGTYDSTFGTCGTGDGEFDHPLGIAIDSFNRIYVVDSNNSRVQKFADDFFYLGQWGEQDCSGYSSNNGDFCNPIDIVIDSHNKIYVSDSSNSRVQKFDSSGNFQLKFGGDGFTAWNLPSVFGLGIDKDDYIYAIDDTTWKIKKYNQQGIYLFSWGTGGGDGATDTLRIVDIALMKIPLGGTGSGGESTQGNSGGGGNAGPGAGSSGSVPGVNTGNGGIIINYTENRNVSCDASISNFFTETNDTFNISCLYQNEIQALANHGEGIWFNGTDSTNYNNTVDTIPSSNYYITCYQNNSKLFAFPSYCSGTANTLQKGVTLFDNYGGLFGAPSIVLIIIAIFSMATGRNSPQILILGMIVVGILSSLGLYLVTGEYWAMLVVAAAVGVFSMKRYIF